jgi:hypothetical protein
MMTRLDSGFGTICPKCRPNMICGTWKKSIVNKPKKMTRGSLIKYAEIDDKEQCDKVKLRYKTMRRDISTFFNDDPFLEDDTFIDQRYLLDQAKKLEDDTIVCQTVNNFF